MNLFIYILVIFCLFSCSKATEGYYNYDNHISGENLSNPLLVYKSTVSGSPYRFNQLCYETNETRKQSLKGAYRSVGYRIARYWNLSCPLELSKHSCAHQGVNLSRAEYAASLRFEPSECVLLSREEMLPYLALQSKLDILFVGNSLIRQVLTGLICDMHAMGLISHMHIDWKSCSDKHHWPCHGAFHCIQCGEHSGTLSYEVYFHGGGSFRFIATDRIQDSLKSFGATIPHIDLIVGQRLDDATDKHAMSFFLDYMTKNSQPIPKIILFFSYGAHFVNGGDLFDDPSGVYNETYLTMIHDTEGVVPCLKSAGIDQSWHDAGHALYKRWAPEGFVWLDGTNMLGEAKIGNSVGKFGDCQHFCLPGPSDEIARAILQFILAVFTF